MFHYSQFLSNTSLNHINNSVKKYAMKNKLTSITKILFVNRNNLTNDLKNELITSNKSY